MSLLLLVVASQIRCCPAEPEWYKYGALPRQTKPDKADVY
jgi:hypothetical protein